MTRSGFRQRVSELVEGNGALDMVVTALLEAHAAVRTPTGDKVLEEVQ